MGAGMFLTSRPDVPAQVFRVEAGYMPEGEAGKDFYVNSNLWSSRFVGLRLFLALGAAGWDGYARHVANSIRLTGGLAAGLKRHGWLLVNSSPMAVACLVPPEGHDAVSDGRRSQFNPRERECPRCGTAFWTTPERRYFCQACYVLTREG